MVYVCVWGGGRPRRRAAKKRARRTRTNGCALCGRCINTLGGGSRIRTGDILLAKQALYQLSHTPMTAYSLAVVGLTRVELVTSSLSGTRSNQLSYKPLSPEGRRNTLELDRLRDVSTSPTQGLLLRKEVIQPLVPQRLPCYDFIPITTHTLG